MPSSKKPANRQKPYSDRDAYSYARFSSRRQSKGSSEERQLEKSRAWAKEKGVTFREEVIDKSRSGFHGDNRKKGGLGRFLAALEAGAVEPGSFFVIESMNRLSRETPYDAQGILRSLLDGGITLVVLYRDAMEIDRDRVRREHKILDQLHEDIRLAHEQSREKSRMAYDNRRIHVRLIKDKVPVSSRCPGWIKVIGEEREYGKIVKHGKYVPHPQKWKVVQDIVAMRRDEKIGYTTIAKRLNEAGAPPLQKKYKGENRKGWSDSSVKWIVTHPSLYGRYVFERKLDGKLEAPVDDYYPAMMSYGDWLELQAVGEEFRHTGGGRSVHAVPNLFKDLLFCARCGGALHIGGEGETAKYRYRRYSCSFYRRGVRFEEGSDRVCDNKSAWQVPLVEGLLLFYLFQQIKPEDLSKRRRDVTPLETELLALRSELAEKVELFDRGSGRLLQETDDTRYQRLQDQLDALEPRIEDLKKQVRTLEQRLASYRRKDTPEQALAKLQAMKAVLTSPDDNSREQLRIALHKIIDRVEVGTKPIPTMHCEDGRMVALPGASKGVPRYPICAIYLKGGENFRVTGIPPSPEWQREVMGWPLPPVPRKYRKTKPGQFDDVEDLDVVGMFDQHTDKPGWFQLDPDGEESVAIEQSKKTKRASKPRPKKPNN